MKELQLILSLNNTLSPSILYLVPQKLQAPSATTVSSSEVELNWEAISEGDQPVIYEVEWSSESGENNIKGEIEKNFTKIHNLTSNDIYSFRVRAENPEGRGDLSEVATSVTCKFQHIE